LPLLLTTSEVEPLLDLRGAVAVLERTYHYQARGQLDQSPPLRLMGRKVRLVAGGLPADDRVGIRLSVGSGGEGALGLLFANSGELLAIMGYPFSELRLSATLALAIDRLAGPRVKRVGLIGSGRLAPHALRGAVAVRPIKSVAVFSPTPSHREAFTERESRQLGIPVEPVARPEEAVERADVVLVSTNSATPTLLGRWLRPEQSVFGCGRPNEFDDDVYLSAGLIVVSSKLHEQGYYDTKLDRPLIRLMANGTLDWQRIAELGQVVADQMTWQGMPVFRESQGGYSDVALASWVYERAPEAGLGREFSFEG
jgi:ornithine cyclodeaminase/alanine dehydrogenase-like protein (mu-crystallin family)